MVLPRQTRYDGTLLVTNDTLQREIEKQMRRQHVPSISAAWTGEDGSVATYSTGLARVRPRMVTSPDTPYAWFSVTKLFTATAVLQLVASGQVSLQETAHHYLPELPLVEGGTPTVAQLLSHTSGLRNPMPLRWIHPAGERGPALDEMTMRLLRAHPGLKFRPGSRYAYSNLNYLILGLLIERVSGLKFEEYVHHHLLRPLGAESAGFELGPGSASGYSRRWSVMGIAARAIVDSRFFGATDKGLTALQPFQVDGAPYGGLVGTATDMLRLGCAMLDVGTVSKESILPTSLARLALMNVRSNDGEALPVGLGWHLAEKNGQPCAHHLGGGLGFRSELRIYPRMRRAIAVVANETSFDTSTLTDWRFLD
ncbi:MAG: serine hydrolase [Acidobacteriota bacterium]